MFSLRFSLRNSLAVDQRLTGRRYSGCSGRGELTARDWEGPHCERYGVWGGLGEQERLAILVNSLGGSGRASPGGVGDQVGHVDEGVAALGFVGGAVGEGQGHRAYSFQEWRSRKAFSSSALGWTSPQLLSRTYWRA